MYIYIYIKVQVRVKISGQDTLKYVTATDSAAKLKALLECLGAMEGAFTVCADIWFKVQLWLYIKKECSYSRRLVSGSVEPLVVRGALYAQQL